MSSIPTSPEHSDYDALAASYLSLTSPFLAAAAAAFLAALRCEFPDVAQFTIEIREFDNGDFPALLDVTLADGGKVRAGDDALLRIDHILERYFADLAGELGPGEYDAATFLQLFNPGRVEHKPLTTRAAELMSEAGCVPPVVLVIRDPDSSNAIDTWAGIGTPVVIDVDLGSGFDGRPGSVADWSQWRESLLDEYRSNGLPDTHPAAGALHAAIDGAHPNA